MPGGREQQQQQQSFIDSHLDITKKYYIHYKLIKMQPNKTSNAGIFEAISKLIEIETNSNTQKKQQTSSSNFCNESFEF